MTDRHVGFDTSGRSGGGGKHHNDSKGRPNHLMFPTPSERLDLQKSSSRNKSSSSGGGGGGEKTSGSGSSNNNNNTSTTTSTNSNRPKLPSNLVGQQHHNNNMSSGQSVSGGTVATNPDFGIFDVIPQDYLFNPSKAEPILHYLPKAIALSNVHPTSTSKRSNDEHKSSSASISTSTSSNLKFPHFRLLLNAAEDDIRLHRARKQAGINNDVTLLSTYKIETDPSWLARQQRLNERLLLLRKLDTERDVILQELEQHFSTLLHDSTSSLGGVVGVGVGGSTTNSSSNSKKLLTNKNEQNLTASEKTQVQLARWQRALELYVYSPPHLNDNNNHNNNNNNSNNNNNNNNGKNGGGSRSTSNGHHHSSTNMNNNKSHLDLDLLTLLETLLEGHEDQEEEVLSDVLSQASQMCHTLVDVTKQIAKDASDSINEVEDAYQIRLEAHELFARNSLLRTEEIQNQFRINGRAALQIGNQLEFAETKRQRCESASMLIRRWWLFESLAEQESMSGDMLKVEEEVRGVIPLAACRMDPLFTRPEHSLDAAKALKQLRSVVKSRTGGGGTSINNNNNNNNNNDGGANATMNHATGQWDKAEHSSIARRFELTANLIQRTSDALEQRLLNSFSEIYSKGGSYDFSQATSSVLTAAAASSSSGNNASNVIDWQHLRDLAHALLLFDSGRNLYQRYVDMVVSSRFPELFNPESMKQRSKKERISKLPPSTTGGIDGTTTTGAGTTTTATTTTTTGVPSSSSMPPGANASGTSLISNDSILNSSAHGGLHDVPSNEEDDEEFDMDAMRSKLSSLFHRVSEVCMQEFLLIAYVFGGNSTGDNNDPSIDILADTKNKDGIKKKKDANLLLASSTDIGSGTGEDMPLTVARALCTRVIGDPKHGLQARINDLLESIDRRGDFDTGAKKLDTFVVIHEKAAGLFSLLRDAAERLLIRDDIVGSASTSSGTQSSSVTGSKSSSTTTTIQVTSAAVNAVESLKAFLTSQELSLNNSHRQGYLNLELRLLHHECCTSLDQVESVVLLRPTSLQIDQSLIEKGILEEYRAPLLPLDKVSLRKSGFNEILSGPLKQSVLRQPLIHATDSLARARLMFGTGKSGGESAARVITAIYNQMCTFYGQAFLYPIVEALCEMLRTNPPNAAPQLPFDEDQPAHDLGVDPAFWVALERIHGAAKAFDRELWAEHRKGTSSASNRVWEILTSCIPSSSITTGGNNNNNNNGGNNNNNNNNSSSSGGGKNGTNNTNANDNSNNLNHHPGVSNSLSIARECRVDFFSELERRGEQSIVRALDTLSAHIQWILVTGGEAMTATGGGGILRQLAGSGGGPYAMAAGSSLEAPNSPAVKSLTYCLRVQFVHIQAALTPHSLSAFWTALSMRLYDILVTRLLQHYYVSTVGAVILSRDVEALRSVSMLAGTKHVHWDILRELLTLYMTPPDALKSILVGPEDAPSAVSDPNKSTSGSNGQQVLTGHGLFQRAGRDQSLVFMSRRVDYRYKSAQGQRKSGWVQQLLRDLNVRDPSDGSINIGLFAAAEQQHLLYPQSKDQSQK